LSPLVQNFYIYIFLFPLSFLVSPSPLMMSAYPISSARCRVSSSVQHLAPFVLLPSAVRQASLSVVFFNVIVMRLHIPSCNSCLCPVESCLPSMSLLVTSTTSASLPRRPNFFIVVTHHLPRRRHRYLRTLVVPDTLSHLFSFLCVSVGCLVWLWNIITDT
jgi:hypothetical protein